ncbi:monooxygenase [Parapusillimonas sp. SGNA-6]|nr:monooxygenase [Parapusillimonas sp. SGNA-6]
MKTPTYDISISGAGPAGSALALILARKAPAPERIAVVGRHPDADATPAAAKGDPRTLALNHGSRVLLEQLGAWPDECASIETVHVSQRGRLGRTLIKHDELGVPRLGSVVAYEGLMAALRRALKSSGVSLVNGTPVPTLGGDHTVLDLGDRQITSRLSVLSDGSRPKGVRRTYRQQAVLATLRASRPRAGWAFERFTREGPLAVLPHPDGGGLYGMVWCCAPTTATRLLALPDDAFAAAVRNTFGERLGAFHCEGERHVFPLSMHAGPSLVNARTVAIGNAAQTLHPVAGQGLNLGLRDAAQLGITLASWLADTSADPEPLLQRYAARRRPDRWLTAGITDFLPRIFATGNPLIEHAGGLALLSLDLLPWLRTPLARHLLQGLRT